MPKDLPETSDRIAAGNVQRLSASAPDGSSDPDGEAGRPDAGAARTEARGPGEGRGGGRDRPGSARGRDPVEVQEGVERIVGRIARLEGELKSQAEDSRQQLFVELSEEIHRAARREVRDTVREALSGPAEAIAGTGHASAILAGVARGDGDIGRGLGEASGVLGIVRRYLDRDAVTVQGEAMKLDRAPGAEGRVAARIGAAKQLIGAAQEELRFVPAEREPAQTAAHAALARPGSGCRPCAAPWGPVDEESLPHVPGVDRGGVPESAEPGEARTFRLDCQRGRKRRKLAVRVVRHGPVAAAVVVAAVIGRMSPCPDGMFQGL